MQRFAEASSSRPFRPSRRSAAATTLAVAALAAAAPGCSAEVTYGPRMPPAPAAASRAAAAPAAASRAAAAPAHEAWPASDAPQAEPEARRFFLVRASQPASALSQAAAPPRVTSLALANTARGEAHGTRAEEVTASATLREGERATLPVRVAPGECATFIAQGGLGVVEVDLFLTLPGGAAAAAGRAPEILVEDPTSGPIAVIGGRDACFPNRGAAPLEAALHVQLRRGGGVVLVQGYRQPAPPVRPRMLPPRGR